MVFPKPYSLTLLKLHQHCLKLPSSGHLNQKFSVSAASLFGNIPNYGLGKKKKKKLPWVPFMFLFSSGFLIFLWISWLCTQSMNCYDSCWRWTAKYTVVSKCMPKLWFPIETNFWRRMRELFWNIRALYYPTTKSFSYKKLMTSLFHTIP